MPFAVDCKIDKGFINRTKTTEAYFNEIRKFPVLNQREERELLLKVKTGSDKESREAVEKLVKCNQRFVVSVAKKWYNGDNIMDVIEEGNIGLLEAIDNFDLNRQERLLTYAVYWIRKYINNYVINKQGIVRPSNANKIYTYVNKARSRFYTLNERYPTLPELKDMLNEKYGITVTDVNDIAQFDVFSIDEDISDDEGFKPNVKKVQEAFFVCANNDIEENHEQEHVKEQVSEMLRTNLTEKEEYVMRGYYGIGREQESMDAMALHLGVCRERIRQLYTDALVKLRKNNLCYGKNQD